MAEIKAFTVEGRPFAGVYLYQQNDNEPGLICAVRPEQPDSGVIFSTEPEQAVENFPCAVYEDANGITRQRLHKLQKALHPRWQWENEQGQHRVWVINDTVTIEALRKDFADRVLKLYAGQEQYRAALQERQGQLAPQDICLFLTETEGFLLPQEMTKIFGKGN